jgi:hypothetical protein
MAHGMFVVACWWSDLDAVAAVPAACVSPGSIEVVVVP